MSDELRRDPSIPRLAAAVTLYHVIIEATLAQPGQHFITSYLTDRDLLPGFREGMEKVAADEQRHIGFGVKLLSDLRKMDPEVPRRRRRAAARGDPLHGLGARSRPTGTCATSSASASRSRTSARRGPPRWRPRCARPGCRSTSCPARPCSPCPAPRASAPSAATRWCAPATWARRSGPPSHRPGRHAGCSSRPIAGGLDAGAAAEPGVIQWEFRDAEPWHVVVANGDTRAERGPLDLAARHVQVLVRGLRGRRRRQAGPPQADAARTDALPGRPPVAVEVAEGCSRPRDRHPWRAGTSPPRRRGPALR